MAAGPEITFTIDATVPEHWFTFNDEDGSRSESDHLNLTVTAHWTVNGVNFTRDYLIPVMVMPDGDITTMSHPAISKNSGKTARRRENFNSSGTSLGSILFRRFCD